MPNKIIITDDVMTKFFDPQNTKSLNEILEEKYEGDLADWRAKQPVLEKATAVKIAAISAGITPNSTVKDFNTQGKGEWLYPAYVDERIHEEVGDLSIMPYLVKGSVATNSLSVVAPQLNLFSDEDNKDALKMKRVSAGADLPIAELKLGERGISLFKYGRAVQATYEALAYMRVDMFSKTLSLIAADVADMQAERAIEVLAKGDGNENPIKTITAAGADSVTQDDLLDLMIAFQKQAKMPVTTLITGEKLFKQIWKMKYPADQTPGVNFNFTISTPQFANQNVQLIWSDKVPKLGSNKDAIIALNSDMALTKYVAPNLNIREISKNIRNQTQLGTISEISGFAKFNNNASLAMILK